jgi:vacuolar-type H+-ATPase subunit E/Vma4
MSLTLNDPQVSNVLATDVTAVHRALLEDARDEANQIVAEGRQAADRVIRETIADVDAEVEHERHRSELTAQAHSRRVLARARNDARAEVLRKQEQLRCELVDRVRAAALEIRLDRRYPIVLDRLEAMALEQLGEQATVERDRQPDGGVVATAGTRRVDYTLRAIADRTLDAMSDEAVRLWT